MSNGPLGAGRNGQVLSQGLDLLLGKPLRPNCRAPRAGRVKSFCFQGCVLLGKVSSWIKELSPLCLLNSAGLLGWRKNTFWDKWWCFLSGLYMWCVIRWDGFPRWIKLPLHLVSMVDTGFLVSVSWAPQALVNELVPALLWKHQLWLLWILPYLQKHTCLILLSK